MIYLFVNILLRLICIECYKMPAENILTVHDSSDVHASGILV